jgi:adenylate cyclase
MAGAARPRKPRNLGRGLAVGAGAALLAAALWLPGLLDRFEATTFDLRARLLAGPGAATGQVATILLDQYSLSWAEKLGVGWPWPRSLYGMIADFCARGGAKALVFDVIYTEETNEDVAQNEQFGDGIRNNDRVVAAMNLARAGQGGDEAWPEGLPRTPLAVRGLEKATLRGIDFPRAEFPIAAVRDTAAFLANTNLPADTDGVYRREPLFSTFAGEVVPTEALAAWLLGKGGSLAVAPGVLTVGGTRVPIDGEGRAILRYRGPTLTHSNYTAASILNSEQQILEGIKPDIDPAKLGGKYVLFGFTAPGLFDLKPTPMNESFPGVEVNATMLDNLLSGDFLAPLGLPVGLALLLVLSLLASMAVSGVSGAGRSVVVYLVFLPLAPALGIAAYALGTWLPVIPLELGVALALVGASLANYATEGRLKRIYRDTFKQYMSHEYIEQLVANPKLLRLGGERKELTIYFSDVQGFTSISERLSPEELTALLNDYLSAMTDIIQEEGGTIDKYEGDAIVAFWNAPLSLEDHAVRGVRAALRCQARLAGMRPALRARAGRDMHQRIGMNSGPAVVGNMGSAAHFNYTMLGDQVNLAARLEGVNKQFGTYTMISEALLERIDGAFPARELSRIAVVGREEPIRVYEPMLQAEYEARRNELAIFAKGLVHFYDGAFIEAQRVFSLIAATDPAAAAYVRKCETLAADPSVKKDWRGVWVMTEK